MDSPSAHAQAHVRPPRIWSALIAPIIALAASILLQIVAVVIVILPESLKGHAPTSNELMTMLATPWRIIALMVGTQLPFVAVPLCGALLSREKFRDRLGWIAPAPGTLPSWAWIAIPLGAIIPGVLGVLLSWPVPQLFPQIPGIEELWTSMPPLESTVFVAAIGVLPGICEETLFRGYLQRRLLQRWKPAPAILLASAAFALAHMDPHTVAFAFPLGLWLGTIAWRCGSILPGMLTHAFINSSWNAFQILAHNGVLSEQAQYGVSVSVLVVAACAFAATLRLITRRPAAPAPVA